MASTPTSSPEIRISHLLSDYVDDVAPLDTLLQYYNVSYQQIGDLIELVDRLRASLTTVSPSTRFVENLYQDLVSGQRPGRAWWARVSVPRRVQSMSNRTKIAAGIGGITLVYLTARSLSHLLNLRQRDETSHEMVA